MVLLVSHVPSVAHDPVSVGRPRRLRLESTRFSDVGLGWGPFSGAGESSGALSYQ